MTIIIIYSYRFSWEIFDTGKVHRCCLFMYFEKHSKKIDASGESNSRHQFQWFSLWTNSTWASMNSFFRKTFYFGTWEFTSILFTFLNNLAKAGRQRLNLLHWSSLVAWLSSFSTTASRLYQTITTSFNCVLQASLPLFPFILMLSLSHFPPTDYFASLPFVYVSPLAIAIFRPEYHILLYSLEMVLIFIAISTSWIK